MTRTTARSTIARSPARNSIRHQQGRKWVLKCPRGPPQPHTFCNHSLRGLDDTNAYIYVCRIFKNHQPHPARPPPPCTLLKLIPRLSTHSPGSPRRTTPSTKTAHPSPESQPTVATARPGLREHTSARCCPEERGSPLCAHCALRLTTTLNARMPSTQHMPAPVRTLSCRPRFVTTRACCSQAWAPTITEQPPPSPPLPLPPRGAGSTSLPYLPPTPSHPPPPLSLPHSLSDSFVKSVAAGCSPSASRLCSRQSAVKTFRG